MTGQEAVFADQLHAQARNEGHKLTAGILAAAAFCIGVTVSPPLAAPRAASVTLTTVEVPAFIPAQRTYRSSINNPSTKRPR